MKNKKPVERPPAEVAADYSAAAACLEDHQLTFLYGWNLFLADKFKCAGREERRDLLGRELAKRGINPFYLTLEEFDLIFAFSQQEHQLRGCKNLLQRIPYSRSYAAKEPG